MRIWLIGDDGTKQALWDSLFSNYFSTYSVLAGHPKNFTENPSELHPDDIVVCLLVDVDENYNRIFDMLLNYGITVICVMNNSSIDSYEKLIQKGLKGILNAQYSSLDTISNAMKIVRSGGVYIDTSFLNKKVIPNVRLSSIQKPILDMQEWSVFSLTSKGLTVYEIADHLQMPVKTVHDYQSEILRKTNSKTMSGAVASGVSRGWFMDFEK